MNHNTTGSICKSLFKVHNETVNIWSHLSGVIFFIALLISVCVDVIPNQLWFFDTLPTEYERIQAEGIATVSIQDPMYFIDTKILELSAMQGHLFGMQVTTKEDESHFQDAVENVVHRIEGISHFSIEQLYSFSYLKNYEDLFNPTDDQLID